MKSWKAFEKEILARALSYPETQVDHPWGDTVVKVKGKVFVFLGVNKEGGFGMSVKLPKSAELALMLPFTSPTGYGLGKSGWVSATFQNGDAPPEGLLFDWLDESYRAVAPAKIVASLGAAAPASAKAAPPKQKPAASPNKKKAAAKKTAAKKKAPTASGRAKR